MRVLLVLVLLGFLVLFIKVRPEPERVEKVVPFVIVDQYIQERNWFSGESIIVRVREVESGAISRIYGRAVYNCYYNKTVGDTIVKEGFDWKCTDP